MVNSGNLTMSRYQFFPTPDNSSRFIIRPATFSPGQVWLAARERLDPCEEGDIDCYPTPVSFNNSTGNNAIWTLTQSREGGSYHISNIANGTGWRVAPKMGCINDETYLLRMSNGLDLAYDDASLSTRMDLFHDFTRFRVRHLPWCVRVAS